MPYKDIDKRREVHRESNRKRKEKIPIEQYRSEKRDYYLKNKHVSRNNRLIKKYGIGIEKYNDMVLNQDNLCEICREPEKTINKTNKKPVSLAIDHDHKTGKVRGLLCSRCNTVLGHMNESLSLYQKHIDYIKKYT